MNSFRRVFWLCGVTLLGVSLSGWTQEQQPLELGGFQTQGSATFGYRFTDIKGRWQKYNELFNLNQGPRLMDFSLFGRANEGAGLFADRYSLSLSGMGGDPFPVARFSVSKDKIYELNVSFRKTYYYWDRNDDVIVPNNRSLTGAAFVGNGLTPYHDWATTRQFATVDFTLHVTRNLRFGFEYWRNTRDGVTFTTRAPFYFGADEAANWGGYARANPYYLIAPVNEVSNRFSGSVDYALRDWNFHYRLGYQTSEQNLTGNNLSSPEQSFNIDEATRTAFETVNNFTWSDTRRLKTPISEFSYDGKVTSRFSLRGGYIFYRYHGPAVRDAALDGTFRTSTNPLTFTPYSVSESIRAEVSEPNHVIDQGFTLNLARWVNFSTDYRYQRFTEESAAVLHSLRDGTTVDEEAFDFTSWRVGMHTLSMNFQFIPVNSLIIRTGLRLMKRDVLGSGFEDGEVEVDPLHTHQIKTASPMITVYYRPSSIFSVRADYSSYTTGASYTRISPHSDKGGRFVFRFQPISRLSVEDSLFIRNRNLLDPSCETVFPSNCYENNSRTNATNISYSFTDNIAAFAGFSYDSYFITDTIRWPRNANTPPPATPILTSLLQTWRDDYKYRVWQGGLSVKAPKYVGFNITGNFVRSTGTGQISEDNPTRYGEVHWPMVTGTFWAEFPKAGRLSLDLQRTYYGEDIVHADDFQANILTIRWTKDF